MESYQDSVIYVQELLVGARSMSLAGSTVSQQVFFPAASRMIRPSVTLSPPIPLDEIQPNLVCELLT